MSGEITTSNLFINTIKVLSESSTTTSASYAQNFYIKPLNNTATGFTTITTTNNSTNFLLLSASVITNTASGSGTLINKFNVRNASNVVTSISYGTERNVSTASLNTIGFTVTVVGTEITINIINGASTSWMVSLQRIESVV